MPTHAYNLYEYLKPYFTLKWENTVYFFIRVYDNRNKTVFFMGTQFFVLHFQITQHNKIYKIEKKYATVILIMLLVLKSVFRPQLLIKIVCNRWKKVCSPKITSVRYPLVVEPRKCILSNRFTADRPYQVLLSLPIDK